MKKLMFFMLAVALTVLTLALSAHAAAETVDSDVTAYESAVLGGLIDSAATSQAFAQVCLQRATRTETIAMCSSELAAATANLAEWRGWLTDWYGNSGYEGVLSDDNAATLEYLSTVDSDQFELAYLNSMIYLNKTTTALATSYLDRDCTDGTKIDSRAGARGGRTDCGTSRQDRAELVTATESIVSTVSATNSQLLDWRSSWYGE